MIRYLLKQMLELVPLLFLVSAAAFFLIRLLPGDPATAYLNSVNVPVTEESLQLVREELGLDDSVQVQYVKWLGQVLQGDLGNSYQTKQPVIQELKTDLKYTGILALAALVWVLVLSAFFGILAAEKANSFWDRLIRGFKVLAGLSSGAFVFSEMEAVSGAGGYQSQVSDSAIFHPGLLLHSYLHKAAPKQYFGD